MTLMLYRRGMKGMHGSPTDRPRSGQIARDVRVSNKQKIRKCVTPCLRPAFAQVRSMLND
jgi:hypothetical protein